MRFLAVSEVAPVIERIQGQIGEWGSKAGTSIFDAAVGHFVHDPDTLVNDKSHSHCQSQIFRSKLSR